MTDTEQGLDLIRRWAALREWMNKCFALTHAMNTRASQQNSDEQEIG